MDVVETLLFFFSTHVLPGDPDAPFFSKLMHPLRFGFPCMSQICVDEEPDVLQGFKRNIPFESI